MKRSFFFAAMLFLLVFSQSCSLANATPAAVEPTVVPPTATTAVAAETDTPLSAATTEPFPAPIQHSMLPGELPEKRITAAADQDSSKSAAQKSAAGGDRFSRGTFERPFNAETMDVYFPQLDIVLYEVFQDETWLYVALQVRGRSAENTLSGRYAAEIDSDLDGRGDFLVLVNAPAGTDWTTNGVEVWKDTNKDVGGVTPVNADAAQAFSDGFDFELFNNGLGDDPDTAWARIAPNNPNTIHIAVKRTLVDEDAKFLLGVWSGNLSFSPQQFDFNDRMSVEEAGAAEKSFSFYPIKGLAELDNTCRVAVGTLIAPGNIGVCPGAVVEKPAKGEPDQPGQPGQPGQPDQPGPGCQQQSCPSGWGWDAGSCSCVLLPPP